MNTRTIKPVNDFPTERKSSIYQHRDLLSVLIRGEWCPIIFNQVDGVECGKIKYHKFALRVRPGLSYTFPVGSCRYVKNNYVLAQKDEIKLKQLPEYYGSGLYETHERKQVFTNVGKGALGVKQEKILRIGKDYITTKKILKGVA